MKLMSLAAVIIAGAYLTGCATGPGEVDEKPVYKTITLHEPIEDVYFRLTADIPKGSRCEEILRSNHYQNRGEFRIYYGVVAGFNQGGVLDSLTGRKQGDSTLLEFRSNKVFGNDTYSDWVSEYLVSGNCS